MCEQTPASTATPYVSNPFFFSITLKSRSLHPLLPVESPPSSVAPKQVDVRVRQPPEVLLAMNCPLHGDLLLSNSAI